MKGAILKVTDNIEKTVLEFLKKALDKNLFDALLIPVKVPAGDSYAWVLVRDKSLLEDANPLPPIMSVQGAKGLSSITKRGKLNKRIAVIMRPCEIRASIELSKLQQIDLENIYLISIDCPGVLLLKDYLIDPKKGENQFNEILKQVENDKELVNKSVRPVCQVCLQSVGLSSSDLHIGLLGTKNEEIYLIPCSPRGESVLNELDIRVEKSLDNWEKKVKELIEIRKKKRKKVQEELKSKVIGLDNLLVAFSNCIGCHNCQSVCPICYCRQCYFESEKMKLSPDDYLIRAETKGSFRFLPDTLLFHLGRMTHMTLSCVGCGSCEDACPMSIEVAQIFSMVGDRAQEVFNYIPGKSTEEPLPLKVYEEDEFNEVEV